MKKFLLILSLLLAPLARAQNLTTVTATVIDPNGTAYALGSYSVTLSNTTNQQALFGGNASFQQVFSGLQLSSTGALSISLPSVTVMTPSGLQWTFRICANPQQVAAVFPAVTLPCFSYTSTGTLVSGTSVDLSAQLKAAATVIPLVASPSSDPPTTTNATWTSATALNTALTVSTTGPTSGYGSVEVSVVGSGQLWGTNVITDAMAYANGDLHTANANWVYQSGTFNVNANAAFSSAALSFAYRSDGPTASGPEWAQGTMVETASSGTQNGGMCVRQSTAAQTGYCAALANNLLRLVLYQAGAQTILWDANSASSATIAPITGDIIRVQAVGSTISLWKNGVCLIPNGSTCGLTDTTLTTGSTGMWAAGNSNSNGISNFQSGVANTTDPTLIFEVADAQGTWFPIQGKRPGASINYDLNYNPVNGNQTWQFTTNGFSNFRIRLGAVLTNGSVTITGQALNPLFTNATPLFATCKRVTQGQWLLVNVTSIIAYTSVITTMHSDIVPDSGGFPVRTNTQQTLNVIAGGNTVFSQQVPVTGCLQNFTYDITSTSPGASPGTFNVLLFISSNQTVVGTASQVADLTFLGSFNSAQNYLCGWDSSGNACTLPQAVPGISMTACASGCPITLTTPGAGANFTFTPNIRFQYRLKSATFTLTTSNTSAVRTVALQYTNNNGQIVWTQAVPSNQGASDTVNYSFSQNASSSCLGANCSMWFPETVIDAGDNTGTGLNGITTLATLITNLQAGDTVTNIVLNFEVKNGTD